MLLTVFLFATLICFGFLTYLVVEDAIALRNLSVLWDWPPVIFIVMFGLNIKLLFPSVTTFLSNHITFSFSIH